MEIVIKAAQLILSLSLLIIFHEFGHFFFSKLFKCRVEKFYLFFDPWFSLFKLKRGDTEYGIGWIPLGGYVKISGMIDESMDKEQMKQPEQPWEFRSKPAYQRLLIMVGGVLMNFIVALIIYIGVLYAWGDEYLPNANAKYGIAASSAAKEIGFRSGDKILSIDKQPVVDFYGITADIALNAAKSVEVLRNDSTISIPITEDHLALLIKSKSLISPRTPSDVKIVDFVSSSVAKAAGAKVNDKIVAINGYHFIYNDEFTDTIAANINKEISLTVAREGSEISFPVKLDDTGLLGISWTNDIRKHLEFKTIEYGFWASIPAGIKKGHQTSVDYLKQFKLIFSKKTKGYEQLGGFITIGKIFPGVWDWNAFWNMTAFLSIILAIMNILPIPALDGGHVMFVLYEMITGRKPSDKVMEYSTIVGLSLLFLLLIYANGNDVIRLFK